MAKKEKRKANKRRMTPVQESLSGVCNVTGLDNGLEALNDLNDLNGMMDCLDAMATAQGVPTHGASNNTSNVPTTITVASGKAKTEEPKSPLPNPPGLDRIPNIRIELARHLHTQTLSTFLLHSCPGLRMPTFERWLLDSKLEESDRLQSIAEEWLDDPSWKLAHANGKPKKKKYGRAAMHSEREGNAQRGREDARKEKDCNLLLSAERRLPAQSAQNRCDHFGLWIRQVERDPVLPYLAMEADASGQRLLAELTSTMKSNASQDSDGEHHLQKAAGIVRELCNRATEACKELKSMEQRLGKYQKLGWESADGGRSAKKRKRGGNGGGAGSVDKISIEWHGDEDATNDRGNKVCSLIYAPKKRKPHRAKSTTGNPHRTKSTTDDDRGEESAAGQRKAKPFVVKLNGSHYRKLQSMFDATYSAVGSLLPKEQTHHAFHAAVFALVIRYSSLSGGQLLNDFRGGGMQGAVHEGVFDCLSRWFGEHGTECFASPFNSTLGQFCSAFPSPDVDGHFGSSSDFFRPPSEAGFLRSGWYELNPPFSPGVMTKMANRIEELLDEARQRELDVTFVVVIPTVQDGKSTIESGHVGQSSKKKKKTRADDSTTANDPNLLTATVHRSASQSFHHLIDSSYCQRHIVLPAREHGYIEGGQHLRPTKYKQSQCSTSVIVLGSKGWMDVDDDALFEREIRQAFASRHAEEVRERKRPDKE